MNKNEVFLSMIKKTIAFHNELRKSLIDLETIEGKKFAENQDALIKTCFFPEMLIYSFLVISGIKELSDDDKKLIDSFKNFTEEEIKDYFNKQEKNKMEA